MSRSAQAGGAAWDSGDAWPSRLGARLGHHASELLIVSIGAAVVLGLRPLPGALGFTVPVALFGFVIASWLLMRAHDRRLCEACMSAMPLDAARQATRYSRRFWMAHTGSEPRFLIPYLIVLIGSNFATSTPGRAVWALMQLSMIYLILSQATHRRLQPWCPWCQRRGWRRGRRRDPAGAPARRPPAHLSTRSARDLSEDGLRFVTERHLAT